ncbi:replication stress response regulator SDE2-like [Populus alba x Populus x berolinensis]|uniref:Replication stress response regulator SDE2-like n=1 Tax=Populus alba x Populus x berolinensis TaxID=444605 RepID=A0AAD6RF91_9ROSI|nr:replication stress response regulator SDE2-like [Populus alba x Populus x berolinensis]
MPPFPSLTTIFSISFPSPKPKPKPKPSAMEDHKDPMPFQIFARVLDGKTKVLNFKTPSSCTAQAIKQQIFQVTQIPIHYQRLMCRGFQLNDDSIITTPESTVYLLLRLLGGKGGFGSLLRGAATKAGQKKTNNFDACRDMSGRRLRHVNAEKRLEEWKAEEEDRRLEKMAEEFIKKKAKKGKKGVGDGEAEKYVAKYREDSAKCAAVVEEAVREVLGNGNGFRKRKGKGVVEGAEAKKIKIWMGKRKVDESDSEGMDEDSSDEENEKSVVLNNGSHSDSNKEVEGSSDSVTGNRDGECSGGASCSSEEEKEASSEQSLKSNPCGEVALNEEDELVEAQILEETAAQNASVACLKTEEISETKALEAEKKENVEPDSQCPDASSSGNGGIIESKPVIPEANGFSQSKPESNEGNGDMEKPLNFDEFNSASELEVLGMERLKTELQIRGLKCGGTLQERAARLFLLKSTPLEKLPKKLLAKK